MYKCKVVKKPIFLVSLWETGSHMVVSSYSGQVVKKECFSLFSPDWQCPRCGAHQDRQKLKDGVRKMCVCVTINIKEVNRFVNKSIDELKL